MVTGCACHDVLVFGHGIKCSAGLGPVRQGGVPRNQGPTLWSSSTRYDPDTPQDIERRQAESAENNRRKWLARNRADIIRQQEFRQSV